MVQRRIGVELDQKAECVVHSKYWIKGLSKIKSVVIALWPKGVTISWANTGYRNNLLPIEAIKGLFLDNPFHF